MLRQVVVAMFGYMTELDKVDEDETQMQEFEIEGHDLISLLYNLMDEFLFRFVTEPFVVCRRVKILELDREAFKIRVQGCVLDATVFLYSHITCSPLHLHPRPYPHRLIYS
jgi:SHS2 domain-containing protein